MNVVSVSAYSACHLCRARTGRIGGAELIAFVVCPAIVGTWKRDAVFGVTKMKEEGEDAQGIATACNCVGSLHCLKSLTTQTELSVRNWVNK